MKTYIWVMKDADWTRGMAIIKAYNHTEAAEILSYEIADLNKTLKPEYKLSIKTEKLHLKELKEKVGFFLPHNDLYTNRKNM